MIQKESITFGDLGISIDVLKRLTSKNLINPTPIQKDCISVGLEGKDIVGIAQTGTGKTLAFGIPALEQILKNDAKCLILLPTRELAIQVEEVLAGLGRRLGIKTALLIGGASSFPQKKELQRNPDIIVATPGRIIDHIKQKNCDLRNINFVVLDEADRMLDIGFMPQIKQVLKTVPKDRQTMLFSATIPAEIQGLTNQYMQNPTKIEVAPSGTSANNIHQTAHIVSSKNKLSLLKKLIQDREGSVLIFTRTKYKAKDLAAILRENRFTAIEMHSNRSLPQRRRALQGFKSGQYKILIATDVAARGLDVDDISLVINHDLPDSLEDYVHRIGRTGRAGKKGEAISFVKPTEKMKLKMIEKIIRRNIETIEPKLEKIAPNNKTKQSKNRKPFSKGKDKDKDKPKSTNDWHKKKKAFKNKTSKRRKHNHLEPKTFKKPRHKRRKNKQS